MVDLIEQERTRFEVLRRRIYRAVGAIGVLVVLYAQYTFLDPGAAYSYLERAIYALNHILLAGFSVVVLWQLARRSVPIERLEQRMLLFFIFQSLIFNSILPAAFNTPPEEVLRGAIGDDTWFLLVCCVLAFHLYADLRGVLIALGVYSLSFTIVIAQVVSWNVQDRDQGYGALIIQTYAMAGMLLGFMLILASYRNRIIRLQTEYAMLAVTAYTDTLTGLPNRRQLYSELNALITSVKGNGPPFCLCLFDLDHFKQINDHHGHLVGDQVLMAVAQTVCEQLRATDRVARWGGEEYAILLPHTTPLQALEAIERTRAALKTIVVPGVTHITASFGLAAYQPDDSSETLLHRADENLYAAKRAGRDRIVSDVRSVRQPPDRPGSRAAGRGIAPEPQSAGSGHSAG
ncbi:MAG: GGDEF domain-containing protein [Chloroflexi bacterium]|nr:GGDEF domain-containing protein [Chloroflexota bacterium]